MQALLYLNIGKKVKIGKGIVRESKSLKRWEREGEREVRKLGINEKRGLPPFLLKKIFYFLD